MAEILTVVVLADRSLLAFLCTGNVPSGGNRHTTQRAAVSESGHNTTGCTPSGISL